MKLFRLVLVGCLALPAIASANKKITIVPATQAQQKLGHFTTDDGMYGFTLDRSTATAKLQIDGDKSIIQLTMEEDRSHGELRGYLFRAPDGSRKLYISVNGSIRFFRNADEHWVTWDRDAKALGAPTVKGTYVPAVPNHEKLGKQLVAIAVRTKQPKLTANDASDLAKVTDAFNTASAAMYVRYQAPPNTAHGATRKVAAVTGGGYGRNEYATDETETRRHKALAKHGAVIHGYSSPDSPLASHLIVDRTGDTEPTLPDGTPGLIWEVNGTSAIFVTFDGGRYEVGLGRSADAKPAFITGAGPNTAWPTKVFDTYLGYGDVTAYAKVNVIPATVVENLNKIDAEWTACAAKGWEALIKQADNNPRMTMGAAKAGIVKLHKACNSALDKYEVALVKVIEERAKARAALLTTATAKAKAAK